MSKYQCDGHDYLTISFCYKCTNALEERYNKLLEFVGEIATANSVVREGWKDTLGQKALNVLKGIGE